MKANTIVDGNIVPIAETVSRTIYVATTGNDITGDGSIGLPYLTIGKALSTVREQIDSGVVITISIGVGTFNMTANDLSILSTIGGAGTLTFQGTFTLVDSGFAMGAADANDPLTYAVSGGNTAGWTLNQWKYYFLKNTAGTFYYPITHNALTPSLSIAPTSATSPQGSEIHQAQTIINLSGSALNTSCAVNITKLKIVLVQTVTVQTLTYSQINFSNIHFNNATFNFVVGVGSRYFITDSSFENGGLILRSTTNNVQGIYVNYNANAACILFSAQFAPARMILNNFVLENPNTGSSAGGISLSTPIDYTGSLAAIVYMKYINCNVGIRHGNDMDIITSYKEFNKIILVNTNYLFRMVGSSADNYGKAKFNIKLSNIYGTPVTRWFYDSMHEFVNLSSGRNIQIVGLIYPESEQNLSATLADNATTNVIVGNKLQNRSIFIDYSITRGTTFETGRIKIQHDGTSVVIQDDTPLGDVGVTLAVNFNVNEIRLACTLTSTGTAATMKYNVSRTMITPLTI